MNPGKKLNLSLYLNPAHSAADQRAAGALQQWYLGLRQSGSERDDVSMTMRTFHRSVYLAGLQLHLLSPRLCQHVAESIGREPLTLAELTAELLRCELLPRVPGMEAEPQEASFSPRQLEQIQLLLSHTRASGETEREVAGEAQEARLERLLEAQQAEFARLHGELERLRALAEQQALQLQQLRLSGRAVSTPVESSRGSTTEELSLAEMAPPTEKMQKVRQKGIF